MPLRDVIRNGTPSPTAENRPHSRNLMAGSTVMPERFSRETVLQGASIEPALLHGNISARVKPFTPSFFLPEKIACVRIRHTTAAAPARKFISSARLLTGACDRITFAPNKPRVAG